MYSLRVSLNVLTVIVLTFSQTCHSLYDKSSDVIELNPNNFESRVTDSDDIWIVEFFAPWCGHCKSLVPEYTKAAKALKGVVKVGSVDADQHQSLGSRFGVRGFPTIKIFGANKKSPVDYSGPRSSAGLIDSAFKELRKVVDSRVGGGSGGGSSGSGRKQADKKDVIELTDSNFEEKVLNSNDLWLVEFFAPWCGHCKNLEPIWAEAATELKGKVKVGALDATVHTVTAGKYNIKGFPTIKIFSRGEVEDYEGGRAVNDIINTALDKLSENAPPPEVKQLINEESLKICEDQQLCVISVLPHILDCDAKCRNGFIDTLKKIGEKFKKNKWAYLWIEAMAQPEVEESLEIGGFGYPAMAVVNVRKMKYSLLRGSFSYDGINSFLRDLMYGRGSSSPIRGAKLPTIQKTESWDGKDGQLPIVDEEIESDSGHQEL
ncbi:protein disulfide-isomerase A6 homolog [Oppia nitens]|uniref:protein disulfide-isomerase A6 homolog n=1 Tax=Oppia nitens TaxID=1686743 RepID=UPI0023DC5CBE|nr:protein disulfide-isomerase A6 homolog [Oppia nitens]